MALGQIGDNTNYDFEEIPYVISVAGVTWENRQEIISKLEVGTQVELVRDLDNKYDKNAIAVKTKDGAQIGWIPRRHAEVLAPEIDAGIEWKAKIESIIGSQENFKGVLIKLFLSQHDVI